MILLNTIQFEFMNRKNHFNLFIIPLFVQLSSLYHRQHTFDTNRKLCHLSQRTACTVCFRKKCLVEENHQFYQHGW